MFYLNLLVMSLNYKVSMCNCVDLWINVDVVFLKEVMNIQDIDKFRKQFDY